MIVKNSINEVTYPIVKLDKETFLIGLKNKFQVRSYINEELLHEFEFNECGFSVLKESIFFYVGSTLIKYNFITKEETLFYKSEASNEIWLFNESYVFEAKPTEVRREYKFNLISIDLNKILWSNIEKLELSNLSDEFLIFTNLTQTVFCRYSFDTGERVWSLDFTDNRINGRVLLITNVLIFPTATQDLIGIEIETGKELWRINNINASHFQIQPITNYLVSLNSNSMGDNWYYVINPLKGEILMNKKFENFHYGAGGSKACITETNYYFISNLFGYPSEMKTERITHLGCINLKTHEIEWIEKIGTTSDRRSEYQKPEIYNNKIYLLDGEQTLHIYEIE